MISRHWRGLAKQHYAEEYVKHLQSETFPGLKEIAGFISASILRRNVNEGIEFLIVTNWESIAAIQEFAGRDFENAVVPENVKNMMVEYDRVVRHYEEVA